MQAEEVLARGLEPGAGAPDAGDLAAQFGALHAARQAKAGDGA